MPRTRNYGQAPSVGHYQCSLGTIRADQGRLEEALASFTRAIALAPDLPEAHFNRGSAFSQLARSDAAVPCYRAAIALRPDFADAHHNLAMALLAQGDWPSGWSEYEWRWKTRHMRPDVRSFPEPSWRGEPASGQTLLIHVEQGFGDTLQFCRFAPLAAARGLRVILEVQPPLLRLLRGMPGVDRVVARGDDLPPFDLVCPMLSLPPAFGTTLATIPGAVPYLHADPARTEALGKRLAATANPRIGLAWAGSGALRADSRRSVPPERLRQLVSLPGFSFVSLQKDGASAPADFPLIDLMRQMADFADTAALIANLDLVIAVDTAVAHLAAALGKPVWLLNRFDACWRWLEGRSDSPWYPTLRLYRQPRPNDWDTVLAEVVRDLQAFRDRLVTP